jgi:hypothetical protein
VPALRRQDAEADHRVSWRSLTVSLSAALVTLAVAAPAALGANPDKKAFWGPLTVNGRSAFPIYHDLGVGIYEMDLPWATTAPTRPLDPSNPNDPAYHWAPEIAYALQQAAIFHMRILLQVDAAPAWANGGHATTNYPPLHPDDLAHFLTAAALHYSSVHLWMIWGEPNRRPNWAPLVPAPPLARKLTPAQAAAPHLYARMVDASYGALKAVSKRNLVIAGNTYTTGDISTRLWIENLVLPNGRRPRMDLYGHNPFSFRAPNLRNPPSPDGEVDFSDLGRLSKLVNSVLAAPHQRIKLFLSEWMIPTAPDDELNIYVTRAVQAQWITDAWRIVRRSSFIYALGWIHLQDDPPGGSESGLLTVNGRPKPGYYAWKAG